MNIGDYVKINNLLIGMIIDNTVRDYRGSIIYTVIYVDGVNVYCIRVSKERLEKTDEPRISDKHKEMFKFVRGILKYRYDDSTLKTYCRPAVMYYSSYARRLVNECNKIMRNDEDFPDTTYKSKCLPHCTAYYKEISKKIYKTRM